MDGWGSNGLLKKNAFGGAQFQTQYCCNKQVAGFFLLQTVGYRQVWNKKQESMRDCMGLGIRHH
jgi:hypothetical protein